MKNGQQYTEAGCKIESRVSNGMEDSLHGRDASDMSVEEVERREMPTCYPDKNIITSTEHPYQG